MSDVSVSVARLVHCVGQWRLLYHDVWLCVCVCVWWGSNHQMVKRWPLYQCVCVQVCVCWLRQGHVTWLTKCSCTIYHLEHVSMFKWVCLTSVCAGAETCQVMSYDGSPHTEASARKSRNWFDQSKTSRLLEITNEIVKGKWKSLTTWFLLS